MLTEMEEQLKMNLVDSIASACEEADEKKQDPDSDTALTSALSTITDNTSKQMTSYINSLSHSIRK